MKALLAVSFTSQMNQAEIGRIKEIVLDAINNKPVLIVPGGKAEVLYLPDNFTDANCYTPEEAEFLIERLRAAQVVIGDKP